MYECVCIYICVQRAVRFFFSFAVKHKDRLLYLNYCYSRGSSNLRVVNSPHRKSGYTSIDASILTRRANNVQTERETFSVVITESLCLSLLILPLYFFFSFPSNTFPAICLREG